jgi:hypothetical protein
MQPIGRLFVGVDDALTQLLQFFINLVPVVLKFFKNLFQCLGKRGLQIGIIIKLDIQVMPDGVFNLGGLSLRPIPAVDLLLEILVKDGNRFNFHFDSA